MKRVGIVARSDNTGLGNQTRDLVRMLNPDKVMLIDFTPLNGNKQHPEWYDGYDITNVSGFPSNNEFKQFLSGLDVLISCETFYNNRLVDFARKRNVKTILQYNYEFLEYLQFNNKPLPDVLLAPSKWNIEKVTELFSDRCKVLYLPPPIFEDDFLQSRSNNLQQDHKRVLHIAGKVADKDRNGTNSVIEMLEHSTSDYELVIRTQNGDFASSDPRVTIHKENIENKQDLYNGFDLMILPRRYAGLCLPMNESLISGIPVFMTNISPNNLVLPPNWLIESKKISQFMTKAMLDVYSADPKHLAKMVDNYMESDKAINKNLAFNIGENNFSHKVLIDKYIEIINE